MKRRFTSVALLVAGAGALATGCLPPPGSTVAADPNDTTPPVVAVDVQPSGQPLVSPARGSTIRVRPGQTVTIIGAGRDPDGGMKAIEIWVATTTNCVDLASETGTSTVEDPGAPIVANRDLPRVAGESVSVQRLTATNVTMLRRRGCSQTKDVTVRAVNVAGRITPLGFRLVA